MVVVMKTVVTVNPERLNHYRSLVADIDGLSDDARDEIISIIVNMMQAFVDAAWGRHPIQLALAERDDFASQCDKICDSFEALGEPTTLPMTFDLDSPSEPKGAITLTTKEEYAP
jgi:hypothetical protein